MDASLVFSALGPAGALIHEATHADTIGSVGETDTFSVALDAGQTLTLLVDPAAGLQPKLQLAGPGVSELASGAMSGGAALLQTVPVAAAGIYTVSVSGLGGTTGSYTVRALLDAALESESFGGPANDSLRTAADLAGSFVELGGGAERGAVLGKLPLPAGRPVSSESFESGVLPAGWTSYSSLGTGRVRVTTEGTAADGAFALLLDRTTYGNTLTEAVWTVNLSGVASPSLTFAHRGPSDYPDSFSGSFTNHANADGVAISADGTTWFPLWSVPGYVATWQTQTLDLASAAASAGIALGPNFQIKFQHYGYPNDISYGRGWDKIAITTPGTSEDWYRIHATAGESLSFAAESLADAGLGLEITSADGTALAQGVTGRANADLAVDHLIASATGDLFVRVHGTIGGEYALAVTRGAHFNSDANDTAATS